MLLMAILSILINFGQTSRATTLLRSQDMTAIYATTQSWSGTNSFSLTSATSFTASSYINFNGANFNPISSTATFTKTTNTTGIGGSWTGIGASTLSFTTSASAIVACFVNIGQIIPNVGDQVVRLAILQDGRFTSNTTNSANFGYGCSFTIGDCSFSVPWISSPLSAGTHNFSLMMKTNANTFDLDCANEGCQFACWEIH